MPLRSQTSRLTGLHNYTRRSCPSSRQSERFPLKTSLSPIKKDVTEVFGIFKQFSKLHTAPFERLSPFFKLLKELSNFYVPTNLVEDFTNLNKLLENSVSIKTTTEKQATYSHVRCMFHSSRICYHDRRRPKPETPILTPDRCTHSVWFKNFQSITDKNVNLCQGVSFHIL